MESDVPFHFAVGLDRLSVSVCNSGATALSSLICSGRQGSGCWLLGLDLNLASGSEGRGGDEELNGRQTLGVIL